jgi:hypothetical protein
MLIKILLIMSLFAIGLFFQNCGKMDSQSSVQPRDSNSISNSSLLKKAEDIDYLNFSGNTIQETRSLIILDPALLNRIQPQIDLGLLLGQLGVSQQKLRTRVVSPGQFVEETFSVMAQRQSDEEKYYIDNPAAVAAASGGSGNTYRPVPIERRADRLLRLWDPLLKLKLKDNYTPLRNITEARITDLIGGPFRLLAVVNRMDLAGDYDPRTQNEITKDPRSLGEIHLLYSVVDNEFEEKSFTNTTTRRPYPMVLALKYRLPILNEESPGVFTLDTSLGHRQLVGNVTLWKQKMQIWAKLWAGLSNFDVKETPFQTRLANILKFATRAEDFLALESNTQIYGDEFEMNSWYVIESSRMLIPRSLRREPFRCMGSSKEVADMVNYYWRGNDLDMTTRDFSLGQDGELDEYKAGYEILRDNYREFLDQPKYVLENPENTLPPNNLVWSSGSCGDLNNEMPLDMKRLGANGDGRIFMLAEGARIRGQGPLWGLESLTETNSLLREKKRHAFAIRTCSGCHSQEGATRGFHVTPRLLNESSKLSAFLTGNRTRFVGLQQNLNQTNGFTYPNSGVTHEYNELYYRKKWLYDTLNVDKTGKAVLYQSLKRPELTDE